MRMSMDWKETGASTVKARLLIRNVTEADMGRYLCAVDNGIAASTRKETFLLVKSKFYFVS